MPFENPAIPQGWLRAFIYFLSFVIVTMIFQLVALPVIFILPDTDLSSIQEFTSGNFPARLFLIVQFFVLIGTVLLTWIFTRFIDRRSFWELGFDAKNRIKDIILGFLAGLILIAAGFFILKLAGMLTINGIQWIPGQLSIYLILTLLISLNEEIAIRGYFLSNLCQSINKWWALLISAFVFMALHGLNPNITFLAIVNLFLAGIFIGVYYIHQKNLWFPILVHLSWNFFQGPVFGFEVSGIKMDKGIIQQKVSGNPILTGGEFGFEGSIILTFLLIIGSVLLHFYASYAKEDSNVNTKELFS